MSPQLDHRLVVGAAHRLRVDVGAVARLPPRPFRDRTAFPGSRVVAATAAPRAVSASAPARPGRPPICASGTAFDRHQFRASAAQRVAGGAARHDRDPGRQRRRAPDHSCAAAGNRPCTAGRTLPASNPRHRRRRWRRRAPPRRSTRHSGGRTRPRPPVAVEKPSEPRFLANQPPVPPSAARRREPPHDRPAKKSLPLSSTTMKAGKSTTSMRQIASMPSSGIRGPRPS